MWCSYPFNLEPGKHLIEESLVDYRKVVSKENQSTTNSFPGNPHFPRPCSLVGAPQDKSHAQNAKKRRGTTHTPPSPPLQPSHWRASREIRPHKISLAVDQASHHVRCLGGLHPRLGGFWKDVPPQNNLLCESLSRWKVSGIGHVFWDTLEAILPWRPPLLKACVLWYSYLCLS